MLSSLALPYLNSIINYPPLSFPIVLAKQKNYTPKFKVMLLPDQFTRVSRLSPVGPHEGFIPPLPFTCYYYMPFSLRPDPFLIFFTVFSSFFFYCIHHFIPFLTAYHTFSSLYVFFFFFFFFFMVVYLPPSYQGHCPCSGGPF